MGFSFRVTTDATGGVAVHFDDGRLTDGRGQVVFSEQVFNDPMDAEFWLLTADLFAQFMRAYIPAPYWREIVAKKSESDRQNSPTLDVLSFYDDEETLDSWLETNEVTTFDAELLEVIPVQFREEYETLLDLNRELEAKWQAQRREQ
jgi:hypothetical protein